MPATPSYTDIQAIAKTVLNTLASHITPDSTEASLAEQAISCLAHQGVTDTWYHNTPALVLLGQRSCLSISGRDYTPDGSDTVGQFNLVTVDLSPKHGDIWGDCARSFLSKMAASRISPKHPNLLSDNKLCKRSTAPCETL